MQKGKIIVLAAPSGCGKSTIINALTRCDDLNLGFSISATTRAPRGTEQHGVNYYFMSAEEFRKSIDADEFVEYEEVYPGRYYGTPKSEIERLTGQGKNVILDLDVNGALGVKKIYGPRALTLFIEPPSIEALRSRLEGRGTESAESIEQRIARAEYELSRAGLFDLSIVNDNLETAVEDVHSQISKFINQ